MKKRIKLLEKLIVKLEDSKVDYCRESFDSGYNSGLNQAIRILEGKLELLKKVDE